jgi:hypothetical protein
MKLLIKDHTYDIEVVDMSSQKIRFNLDINHLDIHDGFYISDGGSLYYVEYLSINQNCPKWTIEFAKFKPIVL